uniref:Uncharacterized protein n=1 Tax=Romanomermis culicivorax TaxID=13658 RepID=A0A915IG10_ROMCU
MSSGVNDSLSSDTQCGGLCLTELFDAKLETGIQKVRQEIKSIEGLKIRRIEIVTARHSTIKSAR